MQVRKHIFGWIGVLVALTLAACANRGSGPQGGPKDITPPQVVSSTPWNGAENWQKKKVEIEFDENIQVDQPNENVVISPAQRKFPTILAIGKKLQINFVDSLLPNTTYTLDFGQAVKDNNEGNVLDGYSFSFSTGEGVDSLQVSGLVVDALTQAPQKGVYVGLYKVSLEEGAWQDSTFMNRDMERIGKTNAEGLFRIIGIAPGRYRVFALNDKNKNYRFDRGEELAVLDTLITPWSRPGTMQDTIWRDTATVDTILTVPTTFYYPNNLKLSLFKETLRRQYLVKKERPDSTYFVLKFNMPLTALPQLQLLDEQGEISKGPQGLRLQTNETKDSLVYWLTDTTLLHQDTLRLICTYEKTDSLFRLTPQTDTLKLIYRRVQLTEKAKKLLEKKGPQQHFLKLTSTAESPFDLKGRLYLNADVPVDSLLTDSIHLWECVNDSTKLPLPLVLQAADSSGQCFEVVNEWKGGAKYQLVVDSAAVMDIYGHVNAAFKADLKVREKEEYATLQIRMSPCDSTLMLQLLDAKGNVVQTHRVQPEGAFFDYLLAGDYLLRCFRDEDGNGEWTTGDYFEHRQPEPVIYYPDTLTLRANWDFEETWTFE